jgi:photosystem II stability/assembly factor-like uncharacterized protein
MVVASFLVGALPGCNFDVGNVGPIDTGQDMGFFGIANLLGVSFADEKTGTVVGDWLLRTTDGGVSWTKQDKAVNHQWTGVQFITPRRGAAVTLGTILMTTDGGATWLPYLYNVRSVLNAVAFCDTNNGLVVGDEGLILRTTNAGESWIRQASGTSERLESISWATALIAVAVGSSGTVLRSTDGGVSWTIRSALPYTTCVYFVSGDNGFIGGESLYRTTDGGVTWSDVSPNDDISIAAIDFVDSQNGIAVGQWRNGQGAGPASLRTKDGGMTWDIAQHDSGINPFSAVGCVTKEIAVAVKGTTIARTTDRGRTWQTVLQM